MHSIEQPVESDSYVARWNEVLKEMKRAAGRRATEDERQLAWLMWANAVLADLPHLKRQVPFEAPIEPSADAWVKLRLLAERARKGRSAGRVKPSERALLIDVGDWLSELRRIETENAASLECLLHAARILWQASGRSANGAHARIVEHIADTWGWCPPELGSLDADRAKVVRECEKAMRESDLVPSWYFHGRAIPADLLAEAKRAEGGKSEDGEIERSDPPKTGDLFG